MAIMEKYRYIDLFAGCGGLSEGFEKSGKFKLIAAVEWDLSACKTFLNRLKSKWKYCDAEQRIIRFDIQRTEELFRGWKRDPDYDTSQGLDNLVRESGDIDIVIGGPPCQAYSVAGRIRDEHGMRYDYRNYLFESYIKVVNHYKPKMVIFENVPGMLSAKPNGLNIVHEVESAFENIGYSFVRELKKKALIDFTEYGVSQQRKRLILFAVRKDVFFEKCSSVISEFYQLLKSFRSKEIYTVQKTIGDLPEIYPVASVFREKGRNFSHTLPNCNVPNHMPRFHNKRDIGIFRELAEDIELGTNKFIKVEAIKSLYTERTGKTSNVHKYYVLRWDEPSNTIPAHLYKDGLRHIHPDPKQARSITVRESARLQSFDDDFEFLGSMGDQYKMVGNAVPPKFSYCLAKTVAKLLEGTL